MRKRRSNDGIKTMQLGNNASAWLAKQDDWPKNNTLLQMAFDNNVI